MIWILKIGVSEILMISLMLAPVWFDALAAQRNALERLYEKATLKSKDNDTLTFIVDREGRMATVKATLTDRTSFHGKGDRAIVERTLEAGSVWKILLKYDKYTEAMPIILKMWKIQDKMPE